MEKYIGEITEEIYNNAQTNRGYILDSDMDKIFSACELYGYGVYSPVAVKGDDGKYYVSYYLGSTCD